MSAFLSVPRWTSVSVQYNEITQLMPQESHTVKQNEWGDVDTFLLKHESIYLWSRHNVVNSFQFIHNSKSISPEHPAKRKAKFQIYKSFSTHWALKKKEDIRVGFLFRILIFFKIHQLSVEHLGSHQRVICGWREIVCFSRSISTLSFLMLSAAPGEVSGPIMRNTCCLTQIENTMRWDERVTARGQLMSPHFQITVPVQREILSRHTLPEKILA